MSHPASRRDLRPRVSILMAVHNGERYLREAVDSILGQSYEDWELIAIDDGSTDSTGAILERYAAQDRRIVVLRNEQGQGQYRARNRGLEVARGDFIAVQDADDVSLPERLEVQLLYLEEHPEAGAVTSAVRCIDEDGRVLNDIYPPVGHEALRAHLLFNCCLFHTTLLARAELMRRLGGYNPLPYAQDYRMFWELSGIAEIRCLPTILAYYRMGDPNSTSIKNYVQQQNFAFDISTAAAQEVLGDTPLDQEAYRRFWRMYHKGAEGLDPEDLERLRPLWDRLATGKDSREQLGPRFIQLALSMLSIRPRYGLHLLLIAARRFEQRVPWMQVAKSLARPWIPRPVRALRSGIRRSR